MKYIAIIVLAIAAAASTGCSINGANVIIQNKTGHMVDLKSVSPSEKNRDLGTIPNGGFKTEMVWPFGFGYQALLVAQVYDLDAKGNKHILEVGTTPIVITCDEQAMYNIEMVPRPDGKGYKFNTTVNLGYDCGYGYGGLNGPMIMPQVPVWNLGTAADYNNNPLHYPVQYAPERQF